MSELIDFRCPECGHANRAPAAAIGRQGKCGGCRAVITVAAPDAAGAPVDLAPLPPEEEEEPGDAPARPRAPMRKRGRLGSRTRGLGRGAKRGGARGKAGAVKRSPGGRRGATRARRRFGGGAGRRDLKHEAHLLAISVWYRIGGVLMLGVAALALFGGAALAGARGASNPEQAAALGAMMLFLAIVYGVLGVGSFVIGQGLWNYRNWARVVAMVLTVLGTLLGAVQLAQAPSAGAAGQTVGTLVWSAAVIWALTARSAVEICSPGYRVTMREQPARVAWTSSPFFVVPAVLCGLGCLGGMAVVAMAVGAAR